MPKGFGRRYLVTGGAGKTNSPNLQLTKRIDILGYPFDAVSLEQTVDRVKQAVVENSVLRISVGNVDMIMKARRDPEFAEVFESADLVIADGVPVIWASRFLGDSLPGRVAGTELVWKCGQVSAETGCNVGLVGASHEVAVRAADRLRNRYPQANVTVFPTPYPLTIEDNRLLVNSMKKEHTKIVLVALGAPRQERWVREHMPEIGANVGIGIGSAFDIVSGDQPWAPRWMRDHGLEWLHRMKLDPRRLAKRYLIEDLPFFWYLLVEYLRKRETS